MRNKIANVTLGIVLICGGVLFALSAFNQINVNWNFDGWWTFFIIVPCIISLISSGFHFLNLLGLGVGVLLFLSEQNIIPSEIGNKLILPIIIVALGIKIILKKNVQVPMALDASLQENSNEEYNAIFAGCSPSYAGISFEGCQCNAIFGGVKLDLSKAQITKNCTINAVSIFGGTDIFLPSNVKVIVRDTSIFGGTGNKFISSTDETAPIVLINSTCIFAGLDVK
ncbi:MAG: LiaF-related protein [Anaerovoracaceae bacterium]